MQRKRDKRAFVLRRRRLTRSHAVEESGAAVGDDDELLAAAAFVGDRHWAHSHAFSKNVLRGARCVA